MEIRPLTIREANNFVKDNHRHHNPVAGCKFAIGVYEDNILHGVAICGRPISRVLDDGLTIEINRVCTDGKKNACSILYGACCRIAKAMGYKKAITYIISSETGTSLKASNFTLEAENVGGKVWTGKRSGRDNGVPKELKKRYVKTL